MKRILLAFLLFLAGCASSKAQLGPYSIGRDPTWFPLRLKEMAVNMTGFTNAMVQEIASHEKKPFHLANVSWNQLFQGLEENDYAGIFTSLDPTVITEDKYTFSDPFILLGPVLVVPADSDAQSLTDLRGTIVGAYQYDESILILQEHPYIFIEMYSSIPSVLNEVSSGKLQGALVPNLDAHALIDNLYPGKLKIVTEPLSNKGLRLITLKGEHKQLIKHFNEGLEKLRKSSNYKELRKKYHVP